MTPPVTSQNPAISFAIVDFPEPDGPTNAVTVCGFMVKLIFFIISSFVFPYVNVTFFNSISSPESTASLLGRSSSGLSRIPLISLTFVPTTAISSTKDIAARNGPVNPRASTMMVKKSAADRLPCDHNSTPAGSTAINTDGVNVCMTDIYFWLSCIQST